MITNRNGQKEVKVNQVSLRIEMKLKCAGGASWSVRTSGAGFGDAFLSNGAAKYARLCGDSSGTYSYVPAWKYEGVCNLLKINPEDHCEEWSEYKGAKKEEPSTETKDTAAVLVKLIDIDRHITENTKAVEDLGYLIMELVEQMKKSKPFEKPKANVPGYQQKK